MEKTDIKAITEKVRRERELRNSGSDEVLTLENKTPEILSAPNIIEEPKKEAHSPPELNSLRFDEIITIIKDKKIEGGSKILFRIDDKHILLLSHIKNTLKIDITKFFNYLVDNFTESHPELKTIIKNSLKNSLKDL